MKTKLFLFLFALWSITAYKAQVSNYSFTQTLSTYGAPNTGSFVGLQFQDDDVTSVNLPFPFTFNGTTYTSVNVCSNGYLSFNTLSGWEYTAISDLATQDVIAPFAQDIFMGTVILGDLTSGSNTITNCSSVAGFSIGDVILDWSGDFGSVNPTVTAVSGSDLVVNVNATGNYPGWDVLNSNGYIKQNVSGTTPNQVCEFEYSHFTRYAIYDEVINFKIRLYENNNKIEFLYGTMIPGTDFTPSEVGLKGSTNTDFKSRTVSSANSWSNSAASTLISDACDFHAGKFPLSGQLYIWAPVTCTPPVVSIVQSNTVICEGSSVTFTASGASSYTWNTGATTSVLAVSPTVSSSYSLVAGTPSCSSVASVSVQVNANPIVNILASSSVICIGASASFTASGASTYSWSNGASGSVIVVSPSLSSGFTVTGEDSGCSSSATVNLLVSTCTEISAISSELAEVSVFPNPFLTEITVRNSSSRPTKIVLYDALGKVVYEGKAEANSSFTLPCNNFEKGVYILRLESEQGAVSRKLIKE